MAAPTTARFGKMRVLIGTSSGADPAAVAVTNLSNTNPATATVAAGDLAKFAAGQTVIIAGATGDMVAANGPQLVTGVAGTGFEMDLDLSGAAASQATGITADPPAPIVYSAPCGFTSKSLVLTKNLQEVNIPDCDNPDAVAWIGRDAQSLSAQITGEGVAAAESVPTWDAAWYDEESVPCRVEIEFSTGTMVYEGDFQVETLTYGAEQGGRVTLNVSMQSDGPVRDTWEPAVAAEAA